MEIKDILKNRRIELGLTMADVAKQVGVSEGTVSRWESGNIANMRRSKIAALAKALRLDPNVIMGWDDPLPSNCTPLSSLPMIPVVGKIAAGQPILAQENIIGYIPTDIKNPDEYFYLHIVGDNMINAGIEDGSDVLIRKQNCAENGQIVACFVNGDSATLKRFKQIGDTIVLMPENSNYEPIIVKCSDFESGYARILGVAVRCVTTKEL